MQDFEKILIVDDSSTSRMIIQRCIDMAGFSVGAWQFAENGLDAMVSLKDEIKPDLILTDINMPKMDGQTLVRLIRGNEKTAKIALVVVSSIARAESEDELLALGVHAIIKKPVSPEKILAALSGIRKGDNNE